MNTCLMSALPMSSLFEECLVSLTLMIDVGVSVKALTLSRRTAEGGVYLSQFLWGLHEQHNGLLCTTSTSLSLCEWHCIPHLSAVLW